MNFGNSKKQFELSCTPKHTLASFIADDLTYHDDQVRVWGFQVGITSALSMKVLGCVCVCEEQGSAAHYSSDPLADY